MIKIKKKHEIEITNLEEDMDKKYSQFDELNKKITDLLIEKDQLIEENQ